MWLTRWPIKATWREEGGGVGDSRYSPLGTETKEGKESQEGILELCVSKFSRS